MLTAIPSYKVLKDWKYFSNTMVLFKRSEQKAQDHLKKKKVTVHQLAPSAISEIYLFPLDIPFQTFWNTEFQKLTAHCEKFFSASLLNGHP